MLTFTPLPPAITGLLLALVGVAAWTDIRSRRIPNWLTAVGVVAGLAANSYLQGAWAGLRFSLAGLLLAFAVNIVLYGLRATGGGDVKLMTAVGALAGWQDWTGIFIASAILGGIAAIALAAARGRIGKTLRNVRFALQEMSSGRAPYAANEELDVRSSKGMRLPRGAVIAVGTAMFLGLADR